MPYATIPLAPSDATPSGDAEAGGTPNSSPELRLYYESFGDTAAPLMLLIMGLGAQAVHWDVGFCERLASRGYHVVRFDNRDIGLSTHLTHLPVPRVLELFGKAQAGEPISVPYSLTDLARDSAALIAHLGYPAAHVVGASMGGMIAQRMAIHFGSSVTSLTSIMSTSGAPGLPPGKPEAFGVLMAPPPTDLAGFMDHAEMVWGVIGSPELASPERVRATAKLVFERGLYPHGFLRQFAAVIADGSRRELLSALSLPALVIHGKADKLIPVEGGRDTAAAIPGATLLEFDGMGHDLPEALWDPIISAIHATAERASTAG